MYLLLRSGVRAKCRGRTRSRLGLLPASSRVVSSLRPDRPEISPSPWSYGSRRHVQDFMYYPYEGSDLPVLESRQTTADSMKLLLLIRAFQFRGHEIADLDPLKLNPDVKIPPEMRLEYYGFTKDDEEREFVLPSSNLHGFLDNDRPFKLKDLHRLLKQTYCGTIGIEYMHIPDRTYCTWIREKLESPLRKRLPEAERLVVFKRLLAAAHFERIVAAKYGTLKRFSIEGCEALIPGLKKLIDTSADLGVSNIVMGTTHRGRLNILANVLNKPLEAIFHEFEGGTTDVLAGSGDVRYHLGTSYRRITKKGSEVHLSLVANPSHLEAVGPVVEGKVRAKQHFNKDPKREHSMAVLLHGDAAFAGQGVVYETMDMGNLPQYTTGGTIHIIINNQIGFTTEPASYCSTMYCTDVAKSSDNTPILHVNGDDPEAVVMACELAAEWRQKFHHDIVVDIVCYRRYGHNEEDEPKFTQPAMYKKIEAHPSVTRLYGTKLIQEGVISEEKAKETRDKLIHKMKAAYDRADEYTPQETDWQDSWDGMIFGSTAFSPFFNTGITKDRMDMVCKALYSLPDGFTLHPFLQRQLERRRKTVEAGEGIDWAASEALAIGSLLVENVHVRLAGQDVERGTFAQRNAILHDQENFSTYVPLNHIHPDQAPFVVTNSPLSEYSPLGFEHGYSLQNPNSLVIWEAQFGDFANVAQVVIDQFVASAEAKWHRQSGLVILLPHGYDGNGPEHSSGRIERFLQLSDSDPDEIPDEEQRVYQIQNSNWQIVNVTTASNYFHALRRQVCREFRKPLVLFLPKNQFAMRQTFSTFEQLAEDQRIITVYPEMHPDQLVADEEVARIIFCSGKVYFDLVSERKEVQNQKVALVRIEQLVPFPFDLVAEQASKYPNAEVVWCQEEPKNMGCWFWISHHLRSAIKGIRGDNFFPFYVGRPTASSPATGSLREHHLQKKAFLSRALDSQSFSTKQ